MKKLLDVVYANFSNMSYINFDDSDIFKSVEHIANKYGKPNSLEIRDRTFFYNYKENNVKLWADYLKDYELIDYGHSNISINGFSYSVFSNDTDIVVSFRGTDELRDIITDIFLITSKYAISVQFATAYKIVKNIVLSNPDKHIHLTGHSLGGALVESVMMSNIADKIESAVTFNGLGRNIVTKYIDPNSIDVPYVISFISSLGLPNPGSIANDILNIVKSSYNSSKMPLERSETSIDRLIVEQTIIKHINNRNTVKRGYNALYEKDSKMFKNLKISLGTFSTPEDLRNRDQIIDYDNPIIYDNDNKLPDNITNAIDIICDMVEYLCNIKIDENNLDKTINYIISQDIVGRYTTHIGKLYVVDNAPTEYFELIDFSKGINFFKLGEVIHKLTSYHSTSYFAFFLSDKGNFNGLMRNSCINNYILDYIISHLDKFHLEYDTNHYKCPRMALNELLEAPRAIMDDSSWIDSGNYGIIVLPYLEKYELMLNDDKITLGIVNNVNHDFYGNKRVIDIEIS